MGEMLTDRIQPGFITKVVPPRRRADLVERPRLLELLHRGSETEVTAVVAPAGYGKTTLLLQYMAGSDRPCCWLTVDHYDSDPVRLLQYVILAIDGHLSGLADTLLPMLDAASEHPHRLRECLARLVTLVHLQAQAPFVLILDDLHLLDGTPSAQLVLEPLLQHLPASCHLLLAGRRLPDLDLMHRLHARRQLELFDAGDLAFTHEEAAAFLRGIAGESASPTQTEAIVAQAEGWAAGLAILAQTQRRTQAHPAGRTEGLFDYLCAEAYKALPAQRQHLLLVASVPRSITAPVLDALLGTDGGVRLEDLLPKDLFVQRIDGPSPTYRFHQLYRDFLQQRFKSLDSSGYQLLHARAAGLLSQTGEWQEAVYHCVEAQDWEQAASILEQAATEVARHGRWRGLVEALALLPAEVLGRRHTLLMLQAEALYWLGEVTRVAALLDRLLPALEREPPSTLLARAILLHGSVLRLSGHPAEAVEELGRGVAMLADVHAPLCDIAQARRQLGICAGMLGDFARAQHELEESLAILERSPDAASVASIHDTLGICLNRAGQESRALSHYRRASEIWRRLDNFSGLACSLVNAGTLHHEQGDQPRAQEAFTEALSLARASGDQRAELYSLLGLGDVCLAGAEPDGAREHFAAALDRGAVLGESFPRTYARCGLVECERRGGELDRAESLLSRTLAEVPQDGNPLERAFCLRSLGLIQRDRGQARAACCSLGEAAGLFQQQHQRREEARTRFVLASIHFEQRRRGEALRLLERVAALLRDLGSEDSIRTEAREAPLLLQYAAANRAGAGLYARLVKEVLQRTPRAASDSGTERYPAVVTRALGLLQVRVGRRQVTDLEWRSTGSKELFLYLLTRGDEARKEEITAVFWPELSPDRASSQFHSNLYRMRRALYPECIQHVDGRYALNDQGTFEYDVAVFQRLVANAETFPRGSEQRAARLRDALRVYRGPFAEEFFSEWAATVRAELERCYVRALTNLAGYHAGRGDYQAGIDLCRRILSVDAYHEGATLELMRSSAALGDLPEALRAYRAHRKLLRDENIGEPAGALTRLYRRLADELGVPACGNRAVLSS